MKIKIIIILEATLGGIRKHVVDLLKGLNKEKFEIYFIYSLRRADIKFKEDLSDLEKCVNLIEISFDKNINPINDVKNYFKLRRYLKEIKPDLVHMHGAKSGAIGRLVCRNLGIKKIIYSSHGGAFHKFNNNFGIIYKYIELFLKKDTHYICVSQNALNQIKKELKVKDERLFLIYNGIDLNCKYLASNKENNPLLKKYGNNKLIVIYPALFLENKGHIEFLKLFGTGVKLNENVKIILLGDGPLREKIAKLIDKYNLNDNIFIEGFRTDIYEYYQNCDLIFLPSRAEAFGYVLLEAMFFKKPVFASNVGAIPELITNNLNGELFNLNELIKVIYRLNFIAGEKEYLVELGDKGRHILEEKFDLNQMIICTENVYRKTIKLNE